MKLFLLTLTAFITLGSSSIHAQEMNVSAAVINSFNTSFKNASDVQWKESGSYLKADFFMNGQFVTAFYNPTGELKAVTKNISPLQLPVTLQTNLTTSYHAYWISELFEFSDSNGTSYYVTLEDSDTKVILKSIGGSWSTYKKERKS